MSIFRYNKIFILALFAWFLVHGVADYAAAQMEQPEPSGASTASGAMSLFSDHKSHRVGDILTVLIVESASASKQAATSNKKEFNLSSGGTGEESSLNFIPLFGLKTNTSSRQEYSGDGSTSRKGDLKATIPVRVVDVSPNGDLAVEGTREVGVNGELETIVLSGIVRPQDITVDNTVFSFNIADARIHYEGKGTVNSGQRPGILIRLINWIF